jgi:2'-5' RNA ligase
VVEVPEAEATVAAHRRYLDENARLGVPAHVTVLYPFVPAERVDADVLRRLESLFARVEAFDYRFSRTAWFGEDVLWLAPDEPAPFRGLTEKVHAAFPDHPPFEGVFDEVVPHLTVGHGVPTEALRAAERDVLPRLPVTGRARAVSLLVQDGHGRWRKAADLPLAGG